MSETQNAWEIVESTDDEPIRFNVDSDEMTEQERQIFVRLLQRVLYVANTSQPEQVAENVNTQLRTAFEFLDLHRECNQAIVEKNEAIEAALIDELTHLHNRRSFEIMLEKAINHSKRANRPLSVMILDLDKFKSLNDNHGHDAGDDLLQKVADALKNTSRPSDMHAHARRQRSNTTETPYRSEKRAQVDPDKTQALPHDHHTSGYDDQTARIGGEEIAVILVNTGEQGAKVAAERRREAIARLERVSNEKHNYDPSASIGIATFDPNTSSLQTTEEIKAWLMKKADLALYAAKRGNVKQPARNQCIHWEEISS